MIKYFYLKAGDFKIFQPQNTEKEFVINSPDNTVRVESCLCPEEEGVWLFLNGRDSDKDYEFIKIERSIKQHLDLIKKYNRGEL